MKRLVVAQRGQTLAALIGLACLAGGILIPLLLPGMPVALTIPATLFASDESPSTLSPAP